MTELPSIPKELHYDSQDPILNQCLNFLQKKLVRLFSTYLVIQLFRAFILGLDLSPSKSHRDTLTAIIEDHGTSELITFPLSILVQL